MNYFRLMFDIPGPRHWYLHTVVTASGNELLPGTFNHGEMYNDSQALVVNEYKTGPVTDFAQEVFGAPIARKALGSLIDELEPGVVQRIPITIIRKARGKTIPHGEYEILNILQLLDCVDPSRTIIDRYPEDYILPEERGKLRYLHNVTLLSEKVAGHHIFRLKMYHLFIMVSEMLKSRLEGQGYTGMWFTQVETSG
jgi:hypothetical protein